MYALNLDKKKRILSATYDRFATKGQEIVDSLPDGNITDYLYKDGRYVYSPLKKKLEKKDKPIEDRLNDLMRQVQELQAEMASKNE